MLFPAHSNTSHSFRSWTKCWKLSRSFRGLVKTVSSSHIKTCGHPCSFASSKHLIWLRLQPTRPFGSLMALNRSNWVNPTLFNCCSICARRSVRCARFMYNTCLMSAKEFMTEIRRLVGNFVYTFVKQKTLIITALKFHVWTRPSLCLSSTRVKKI